MIDLRLGDCIEVMKTLPDNSVDSIVCDPPYHLTSTKGSKKGFMGKEWDGGDIAFRTEVWEQALRVLKPGGHLLAFGGSRTYHRLAVAIEDAGFEIRDQILWIYGSGFPKSLNIGKKVEGYEGWGTALKPAHEPIVMARKPLSEKSVALNVLEWGTGGININESRIEGGVRTTPIHSEDKKEDNTLFGLHKTIQHERIETTEGRFPANVMFDDNTDENWKRYFYCPKASKKEKGEFNTHPTTKPILLMEYLIKLITPKGGVIMDCFMGSGSTGVAAIRNEYSFIGIEKETEYMNIAEKRINYE